MGAQDTGVDKAVLQAAAVLSSPFPGVTQGGANSLGTPTVSRVTLTMQPTQKPLSNYTTAKKEM